MKETIELVYVDDPRDWHCSGCRKKMVVSRVHDPYLEQMGRRRFVDSKGREIFLRVDQIVSENSYDAP